MGTTILAAKNRLFKNVFVCRKCGQKKRTDAIKVIDKKVSCRRCDSKSFRPIKSKKK